MQVYAVFDDLGALRRVRGRCCLPDPRPRFGDSDGDGAPHRSVHRAKHDMVVLNKQGVFCQEFANIMLYLPLPAGGIGASVVKSLQLNHSARR